MIALMKQHPTFLTRQELDRQAAALFAWLVWALFLIIRLGVNAHRSKRLKHVIARCERFVHSHLICVAFSRMHTRTKRAPLNIAPGLRARKIKLRLLARSLRLRGKSFYARILHLLRIYANPEPSIARLARKLRSGRRYNLVLATAITEALACATPRAIACADSS